ncbi:SHOCT domain-containing protein [Streptomyces puniciscabiei]|uniref:SHOCT domain-containing protein n=1 Tax=Streptomyces puniciscabiei TaxID=164348 RepID=UPI00331AB978
MPGLLRGVARTAVVAGTATAVSNRVSRRQAGRWAQQDYERQQQYEQRYAQPDYAQPEYAQPQQPPPPPPAAPPPAAPDDMTQKIDQLKQLADLKAQGVLTEEEFADQKRLLLG